MAGLLVFGTETTEFFASGSIEAACYRGTGLSSDDLIHAERLAGPVSDQIDAGIAFIARFMRASSDKCPVGSDAGSHDLDVVDEAIANAAAHRDYAIPGPKIRPFLSRNAWSSTAPASSPTHSPSTTRSTVTSPATSLW